MLASLGPGQTGCLRAGTYYGEVRFDAGGQPGAPVTLQSYPGERATLAGGYVYVPPGSNYVTIRDLDINGQGTTQISVQILGNHASLIADDITNDQQHNSCVTLGYTAISAAVDTVVEGNLIHDCGSPSDGNQDHAIYFNDSYGAVVTDNVIWGTAAFAIHLYEHADFNRIVHNVIVDNGYGVIFAGSAGLTSSGNLVARNVIADSSIGDDVMQSWAGAVGQDNRLQSNCIYSPGGQDIMRPMLGFTASGNVFANPRFVDAAAHNYVQRAGSPCLRVVGYDSVRALFRLWAKAS